MTIASESPSRIMGAALAGIAIGVLGGLIGLGGAEFRLPVLIALFGFAALQAVILSKAMSLVVVTSALFFRMGTVPLAENAANWCFPWWLCYFFQRPLRSPGARTEHLHAVVEVASTVLRGRAKWPHENDSLIPANGTR